MNQEVKEDRHPDLTYFHILQIQGRAITFRTLSERDLSGLFN